MVKKLNLEGLQEQSETFKAKGIEYVITEPSEEATKLFRQRQGRNSKVVEGKLIHEKPEDKADLPAYFVSLCTVTSPDKKPVALTTVLTWQSQLVSRLFNWLLQFLIEPADTEKDLLKEREELDKRLEKVRAGANDPKD